MSANLKHRDQCVSAANKALSCLGRLKQTFVSRDKTLWLLLYKTYIRPHLEYCAPAWSPYLKGDIDILEKVQRKATKIPTSLKHMEYTDRYRVLGLDSLENRRIRTDIITFYKIVHSINTVNWVKQLTKANPRGRSGFKFIRELNTRDSRHFFFTNRTIAIWNTLNEEEYTNAPSVQVLKSNLNKLDLVEMANKH